MNRLDLELLRTRRFGVGWVALGVAALVIVDAGQSYLALSAEYDAAAERVAGSARARSRVPPAAPDGELARSLQQADQAVRSLSLPWDELFHSIEEVSIDDRVALLALQPDPQKGELAISGEAADYAAILAYIERLDQRRELRDVHLVRHEVRQDDPQRPFFFTIAANWVARS